MSYLERNGSIVNRTQEMVLRSLAFIGLKGLDGKDMPISSILTEGKEPIIKVPTNISRRTHRFVDLARF